MKLKSIILYHYLDNIIFLPRGGLVKGKFIQILTDIIWRAGKGGSEVI